MHYRGGRFPARCVRAVACVVALAACSGETAGSGDRNAVDATRAQLVVYAAASTRDAMQKIAAQYEAARNIDIVFSFGSSGDLARQIIASPRADVFLSADEVEMNRVDSAGLVSSGSRRDLLSNQLVVIEPQGSASLFAEPFQPDQLRNSALRRLSLANVESVPAGRYAKAWLQARGVWDALSDRVLPGVDVRAALAAVEAGAADAGIVYRTDVTQTSRARIVHTIPTGEAPRIVYPVAAISGRQEAAARAFIEYLASPDAARLFQDLGFLTLSTPVTQGRMAP